MKRKYTMLGAGVLVLAFIVWMIVTSMPTSSILLLPMLSEVEVSQPVTLLVLGFGELLLVLPLVVYMLVTGTNIRALMGNRTNLRQNLLALLLGICLAPALVGVSSLFSQLFIWMGATLPDMSMLQPRTLGALLVGVVTIGAFAGIAEEPIFRGVVQRGLGSALNRRAAVVLTALVFAVIHMDVVGIPTRFIIGLVLGYMAWRCGAILPGIIAHAAYNSTAIGMDFLLSKALPGWSGFSLIPGASPEVDSMLTWLIISIPFAALCVGIYVLFARVTPKSSAWGVRAYARAEVRPVHVLAWVGAGVLALGFTALTALSMWLPKLMGGLEMLPGFGQ